MAHRRRSSDPNEPGDPRFAAAVEMLGRTGADSFQIRYCEEEEPVAWIAVAHWPLIDKPDVSVPEHFEVTAGLTPWRAVFRLCEAVMDGGTCRHCHKPTMVDDKPPDDLLSVFEANVCSYRFDPEMSTFRRSCEGVVP